MRKRNADLNPVVLLRSHALMREGIHGCTDVQPAYRAELCATNCDALLKAMERMAPRMAAVRLPVPTRSARVVEHTL